MGESKKCNGDCFVGKIGDGGCGAVIESDESGAYFICSQKKDHPGPHIACAGKKKHNVFSWEKK